MKRCQRWKEEQKTLWEEVWKETGRGRWRWKAHELFAERGCRQTLLAFLSSTDVGKIVPAVEEADDTGSEASEWELRERRCHGAGPSAWKVAADRRDAWECLNSGRLWNASPVDRVSFLFIFFIFLFHYSHATMFDHGEQSILI